MKVRLALCVLVLLAISLPERASAQEYVRNGTFDQLYAFDWQTSGQAWDPGNKNFAVATVAPNPCFGLIPDRNGFVLSQAISVPAGARMIAKADVAIETSTYYSWQYSPHVQMSVGGPTEVSWGYYQPGYSNRTHRVRLETRFVVPASGIVPLEIRFYGPGQALSVYPRFLVDNISIQPSHAVTVHPLTTNLALGSTQQIQIYTGTPGPIQLYVSPLPLAPALTLPGWIGEWGLDIQLMSNVYSFGVSPSGWTYWSFQVPNALELRGVPVYWQSLHAATTQVPPVLHLGSMNSWAFF